jgi:hypothetical protein
LILTLFTKFAFITQDYTATANTMPTVDTVQNVVLIEGLANENTVTNVTDVTFTRKLSTGDTTQDKVIEVS